MTDAFTPGPWQAKHDYTVEGATTIIANVDGEIHGDGTTTYTYDHIATCEDEWGDRLPNAQANARLIAIAPDMFEALECIQRSIRADDLLSMDPEMAAHADSIDTLLRPVRGVAKEEAA